MKTLAPLVVLLLVSPSLALCADTPTVGSAEARITPLSVLQQEAHKRVGASARVALADEKSDLFKGIDSLEPSGSQRVPNYLRAIAIVPGAVEPLARLVKAFLYTGQVAPELKMAMALRIAQIHDSPYVAAHMERFLRASGRGQAMLGYLQTAKLESMQPGDRLALRYAENLTRSVHGVSDSDFREVRGYFNDPQIVELTMTVAFFNYFTRYAETLNLPVEPWVLDSPASEAATFADPTGRVGLLSDEEIGAVSKAVTQTKEVKAKGTPGLVNSMGMVNSQRAMLRWPGGALAWREFMPASLRDSAISPELKLQVSFAVSMANGCRYCTLHQVLGLRLLGVDPYKLQQMRKDDSALTPSERIAVEFTRKVTRAPASITDEDYARLQKEFSEKGALEVLLQTCNFNYMNRLTDGLHLPSEDEAVRVYRETYGSDWKQP